MPSLLRPLASFGACTLLVSVALAQPVRLPPSIVTPDQVNSRIGTLEFKDGLPTQATLDKVYDQLDFMHAQRAFADTLQGVSIHAIRKGLKDVGVKDNEVIVFSQLMDAKSLFLTANADTVYVIGGLDLTKGPMVLEVPPQVLGTVQDAWFRWVVDVGLPGPDRGEGGKYLIVPPGYTGPLPRAASPSRTRRRTTACGSHARSSRTTTTRSRWPSACAGSPRSTRTPPVAWGRRSPSSWPARRGWAASAPRRRRCSTKAAAR